MKTKNIDLIEEQKKFEIFKNIFEAEDELPEEDKYEAAKKRLDRALDNLLENKELKEQEFKEKRTIIFMSEIIRYINNSYFIFNDDDYGITEEYYPHVLNQISKLAGEFRLKNSLEISNLFTYLLWNGYLSKTKQNVYRIEKRKLIEGLLFADIMDGVGVCLNHADMLKDVLNTCGYNASIMINLVDKNTRSNYKLDIERKVKQSKKTTEFFVLALTPIIKKIGNHAFTLVEDNGLYIYDSTNLILLNATSPLTAEVINGTGTYKLNPYFSYAINNNPSKGESLSKLFTTTDFSSPYSRKDYIITGENNMETFRINNSLIEDFYDEIRLDLLNISEATDKIKIRKKQPK